jgi:thiamine-monophosphate kinase
VDEFEIIERFFDRRRRVPGVVTGIGDDGAVVVPEAGMEQVQVIDTLVEGVHFPADTKAADIGYRVVAVNLSDIAAMGARPRWMTLALTLPQKGAAWIQDFATGLFEAADEFDVALVGGDMTRGDVVVATVHVSGDVAPGRALLRSGASAGEAIFVTGTLGDAAAGLELWRRGERDDFLLHRFFRPRARVATGRRLAGRASAAIDVSDGLIGDLAKLLQASNVGGELEIESLPLSAAIRSSFDAADCVRFALSGGDDYELCFTSPPENVEGIDGISQIGKVTGGAGVLCRQRGAIVEYEDGGYRHFQ